MISATGSLPAPAYRRARQALWSGAGCALILIVAACFDPAHAFRAYFIGWYGVLGVVLGAMAILMLQHLTGGDWGSTLRPPAEALAGIMPWVAIAFLPIALGMSWIFPWADSTRVAHESALQHRHLFFSPAMVVARSVLFLLIWCLLARSLRRPSPASRLRAVSAGGLVVYFLTMSAASVDWVASREVDWYSSTFGFMTITGQSVAGLCVLILACVLLRDRIAIQSDDHVDVLRDWGNLLQTTVVLWAYVSFAQFLVIWTGNSQEDNRWFIHRTRAGWQGVGALLIVGHFALPFVLLLFQGAKRSPAVLGWIALGLLGMRWVDWLWQIVPSSPDSEPHTLHVLDLVGVLLGMSFLVAAYVRALGRTELSPVKVDRDDDATCSTIP